jgi:SHO1 osmosensor
MDRFTLRLATLGISIIGWTLSFIATIVAAAEAEIPSFTWWALCYSLACIIAVALMMRCNAWDYCLATIGYLSAAVAITTVSVDGTIRLNSAASRAASAGLIAVCAVFIVWMFLLQTHCRPRSTSTLPTHSERYSTPSSTFARYNSKTS